jgi:hypothetical protein
VGCGLRLGSEFGREFSSSSIFFGWLVGWGLCMGGLENLVMKDEMGRRNLSLSFSLFLSLSLCGDEIDISRLAAAAAWDFSWRFNLMD